MAGRKKEARRGKKAREIRNDEKKKGLSRNISDWRKGGGENPQASERKY